MKEIIHKIANHESLTQEEAYNAMKNIMSGQVSAVLLSAYLTGLRLKSESIDEITGSALAMRDASLLFHTEGKNLVDTCGTGGDGQGGVNMSTVTSFVVAGAGYSVAKHGNRAASSKSGSADVLEVLGVRIDCPSVCMEDSLRQEGICFLFAPNYHPAMKHAMPTRRELGIRTIFNILGPLSNPARVRVQLIGVYDRTLTLPLAKVLTKMGHVGGLVVHSAGWDEITLAGPTHVSETLHGKIRSYKLTNKDFGLPSVPTEKLVVGDAVANAQAISEVLEGKVTPIRHVVVANAAATIWIAERAYGKKTFTLKESVKKAQESIDSGKALKKLKQLAEISHSLD